MTEHVVDKPESKAKKSSKTTNNATAPAKRLIFVTGDKGGVGKSCFARLLLDIYRTRHIPCRAFDSDTANPDLYRYYKDIEPGVERVDFTNKGASDYLIDVLPTQQEMMFIDLPARSQADLASFIREVRLTEEAERYGFRVTFCSVISKERTSVLVLHELIEMCGNAVDYVVIKNLVYGSPDQFHRYNESETRKQVKELGGIELDMLELFYTSWDAIADKDLPFRVASNREISPLTITQTARTKTWLEDMEKVLQPAYHLLGL